MKVGYSLILFCLALSLWANEETEFVIPKIVKNHNGVMTVINSESLNQFIRPYKDNFNSEYLKKIVQKYKDPQNTPDKSCLFYTRSYRSAPIPKGYLEMLGATFLESICTGTHTSRVFQGRKTLPDPYFDVLTKIKALEANSPQFGNLTYKGKIEFKNECKLNFSKSISLIEESKRKDFKGKLTPKKLEEIREAAIKVIQESYFKDLKSNLSKSIELIDSNIPSNPINLAINYSMLTALGIDETEAYPLTDKHTDSESEANWESGLFHLSTDSFYPEDVIKTDTIKDMNEQPIHRNDLKKTFLSYITQIQKITYLPEEEALPTFSKYCGIDSINKDFFEKYFEEYNKRNGKNSKKNLNNLGKEPFNYERDYSPKSILNVFKQLFEKEKSPQTVVSFLHNDIKNPALRMINEKFLKSGDDFSLHFIDTFRKLQYYCPKFATQFAAISLRINATHQGSIERDSLYPHCLKFYLELTKDKDNACKI